MTTATATLTGHLGEVGTLTPVGSSQYLGFRLATNRRVKVNGDWTNVPTWWGCRIWGDRATGLADRLSKGDLVVVTGEPYLDEWTGRDGQKRSTLRVTADRVVVVKRAADRPAPVPAPTAPAPATQPAPSAPSPTPAADYDDTPPF